MKKICIVILTLFIGEISGAQNPDTWYQKQDFPQFIREYAVGFSIGAYGYVGTGSVFFQNETSDFWQYNPVTGLWTQKASLPNGAGRAKAVSFTIGNKGYVGTGIRNGSCLNDFWEYDPFVNTWTQKSNFGGAARYGACGFSIGNKGYIGSGDDSAFFNYTDFWEYNVVTDTWTQKSGLNVSLSHKAGFSIGNKGYMGGKYSFYQYDPAINAWTQKAYYPGSAYDVPGFSIGGKGYIGTGENTFGPPPGFYQDFWEYDPVTNAWTQRSDFGGTPRRGAVGLSIGTKGYIGIGFDTTGFMYPSNDFWEYTPYCTTPVTTIYSSGNTSFCSGDSVFLYANNGYNYQWKKNGLNISGATSYYYNAKATGSYTCYLTNSCGAVTSSAISVTVNALPITSITPTGPTTFCSGGNVVLNAVVAPNRTYQWKKNGNPIVGATLPSYTATTGGNYKVIVTNTLTGCSKMTFSPTVVTVNTLPAATVTPQGPTTFCAGGSVVLQANTGTGLTYKWKKNGSYISGATLSNYTATTPGTYKIQVTSSKGCTRVSTGTAVTVPCKVDGSKSENDFDIDVYPNPSIGEFTIRISKEHSSLVQIEITDDLGRVMKRFETDEETITISESNLANGIYCLTARYKDEMVVKRISVVR